MMPDRAVASAVVKWAFMQNWQSLRSMPEVNCFFQDWHFPDKMQKYYKTRNCHLFGRKPLGGHLAYAQGVILAWAILKSQVLKVSSRQPRLKAHHKPSDWDNLLV